MTHRVGYVATARIKVGEDWLEPGDVLPALEGGRNYNSMVRLGHIAPLLDERRDGADPPHLVKRGPGRPRKVRDDD